MTRRGDLPSHLDGSAFHVRDHSLHGCSPSRLRASDLQRPFAGVRSVRLDLDALLDRCRAYEPLLREGEAFSHWTAAELYGLPLPRRSGSAHAEGEVPPIEVTCGPGFERARSVGVLGHESTLRVPTRLHLGLPVVEPGIAWCQTSSTVRLDDLIALGDAIVTGPRSGRIRSASLATLGELREAVIWWGRRRGARALGAALERVRVGAESRPETHLRVMLVDYGLPEPLPNHPVVLATGAVVHPDLAYLEERIALEYQGDRHRTDRGRWQQDLRRRRDLEHVGWTVVEVTAHDLYVDPRPLIARVRGLLHRAR